MNYGRNAFQYKEELDPHATTKPITIAQCGFYVAHDKEMQFTEIVQHKEVTNCLLVYQHKGTAKIPSSTKKILVKEGSIILFPTNDPRRILYCGDETNERYYLYLRGTHVVEYLTQFGFKKTADVYYTGVSNTLVEYFLALLDDFRIHDFSTDVYRITLLFKILAHINKRIKMSQPTANKENEIKAVLDYMEKNYHKKIVLEDCAKISQTSVSNFIRLFKLQTGSTPYNYLINLRLTNAMFLLKTSNLTVSEIALQTGFDDALYFCKFFKKSVGVAPTDYRKSFEK